MVEGVWSNAYVAIESNDISTYVKSVSVVHETESVDQSAMGDATRTYLSGLEAWSVELEMNACAAVDHYIYPLIGVTSAVLIEVRETTEVVGTTNPEYTGSGVITSYSPFGGGVGELRTASLSFVGATTLARVIV